MACRQNVVVACRQNIPCRRPFSPGSFFLLFLLTKLLRIFSMLPCVDLEPHSSSSLRVAGSGKLPHVPWRAIFRSWWSRDDRVWVAGNTKPLYLSQNQELSTLSPRQKKNTGIRAIISARTTTTIIAKKEGTGKKTSDPRAALRNTYFGPGSS